MESVADNDVVRNIFKLSPIFCDVSEDQIKSILHLSSEFRFHAGEFIIKENERADNFYIIESGTIEVLKYDPQKKQYYTIRKLGAGEVVGEIGLLVNRERIAFVRALTPVVLVGFPIKEFTAKIELAVRSQVMKNIALILVDRLDYAYEETVESMRKSLSMQRRIIFVQFVVILALLLAVYL